MPTRRPHDRADLLLAPVALDLDARLTELGSLTPEDLAIRVTVHANTNAETPAERRSGLLDTVTAGVELHHWLVSWDDRGLRLSHEGHTLVLGLPTGLRAYLAR
jgi:hypothetical protein